ncbi:hypothetical protein KAR91_29805 [Candidatus Pacearchaeota archaeon]|nr:hypothetical protein [Candidatus Pacearchaeota archaeon]
MQKAILISTGIKLNVIGESGSIATEDGVLIEYRVKKETCNDPRSTFRVAENKIVFIEVENNSK